MQTYGVAIGYCTVHVQYFYAGSIPATGCAANALSMTVLSMKWTV